MEEILAAQYEMLKDSRKALFKYCESINESHFIQELKGFGGRSIRNLMVHVVNVHEFWIGQGALNKNETFTKFENANKIQELGSIYQKADLLMKEFLEEYNSKYNEPITINLNKTLTITPLKIFTHVLTHEFHHKGQILSMSRQLGYIPVDTDIIR
jgi:uncharacterized damage-inducible protein DinB